jgi:hypothetical protein
VAGVRDLALEGGTAGTSPSDVVDLARGGLAGLQRLHVNLSTAHDREKAALLTPPHFPRLDHVSLPAMSGGIDQTSAALAVARAAPWRSLRLPAYGLSAERLIELLSSPALSQVAELVLRWPSEGFGRGEGPSRLLARIPPLPHLRTLRLIGEIRTDEVRGLASAPFLAEVRALRLELTHLDAPRLDILLQSPHLGNLEVLGLFANPLGDAGAVVLAQSPVVPRLRVLMLNSTGIGPLGVQALAWSFYPHRLQVLDLFDNPLGLAGWGVLAAPPHWEKLQVLNLGATAPVLDGVKALARSPVLRGVRRLLLQRNRLRGGHVKALLRSPHLGPLTSLVLRENQLEDNAAGILADCPALGGLRELDILTNFITEGAARRLADSPHLNRLALLGSPYPGPQDSAQAILFDRFGRDVRGLVFADQWYRRDI